MSDDTLGLVGVALMVNALTWLILYFLGLNAFSKSVSKDYSAVWTTYESKGGRRESRISTAFRILVGSAVNEPGIALAGESLRLRKRVLFRLTVGVISMAAMFLYFFTVVAG